MAAHAFGGAGEIDHLLAEQRGLADQRRGDALFLRFAQEARALFLVEIDEDRVGIGALDLDDVGGEIDLARFGGDVGDDLDVARRHFLDEGVAAALAEIVVDPDDGDRLRLDAVANVVGDLRHAELLAERGAEDVRVVLLGDRRGLAADDLGNLGLLA